MPPLPSMVLSDDDGEDFEEVWGSVIFTTADNYKCCFFFLDDTQSLSMPTSFVPLILLYEHHPITTKYLRSSICSSLHW